MSTVDYTVSINPADGSELGRSGLDSIQGVKGVIEKAGKAQPAWAARKPRERAAYLKSVRDYLVEHKDELSDVISRDNGKTKTDALSTEVLPAAMAISYYLKKAPKWLKPRCLMPGNLLMANKLSRIHRVPLGVVGVISPWNYPFAIPFSEVVMALLAGNSVVLKTASQTQMVGRKLEEAFKLAGLPEGVFNFVNLPGAQAGEAFITAGVDKLFFTGSVAVGKKLMALAAQSLTRVSLELGGNDAMLVCEDADLSRAASGAVWAGLSNAGQSCGGVERIYVHEDVYDRFLALLRKKVEALRVGPDLDCNVDIGCMTTAGQVASVRAQVDEALAQGAKVFASAKAPRGAGNFLPPQVLVDVDHSMRVMREETFGPVLAVMPVKDMDQAVELANDSNLGLTGSVWSGCGRGAKALARRIKAGAVTINDHLMSHGLAETPWGGFKESGIGRTHGELGFAEMTEPQVIVNDILPGVRKNMWWHPHGPKVYRGLSGIIDFLYGKGPATRFRGLRRLLICFMRSFRP